MLSLRCLAALLLLSLLLIGCDRDPRQNQYRNAMQQLVRGDYRTAALTLNALAQQGYAPAQFRLGSLYRHGLGVPRNERHAVYWFEKAAQQEDIGGQYRLAESYQRGEGIPVTPELAFHQNLRERPRRLRRGG